ncbi:MAG: hypothetical protein ACR2G3_09395 [Solirubrobacterales bacterium]
MLALVRLVGLAAAGLLVQDRVLDGMNFSDGGEALVWATLIICTAISLLTWEPLSKRLPFTVASKRSTPRMVTTGPELVSHGFQIGNNPPETKDFVVVRVYNGREGAGQEATAKHVMPEVIVNDMEDRQITRHKGWDVGGHLDFSPSGEEHTLFLVEKIRSEAHMYAVNGAPATHGPSGPHLTQGESFHIEVALRGNFKTVRRDFTVTNTGPGQPPHATDVELYREALREVSGVRGLGNRLRRRLQR